MLPSSWEPMHVWLWWFVRLRLRQTFEQRGSKISLDCQFFRGQCSTLIFLICCLKRRNFWCFCQFWRWCRFEVFALLAIYIVWNSSLSWNSFRSLTSCTMSLDCQLFRGQCSTLIFFICCLKRKNFWCSCQFWLWCRFEVFALLAIYIVWNSSLSLNSFRSLTSFNVFSLLGQKCSFLEF